jgi:hypothetical protein
MLAASHTMQAKLFIFAFVGIRTYLVLTIGVDFQTFTVENPLK